jgi:hypothetical protein
MNDKRTARPVPDNGSPVLLISRSGQHYACGSAPFPGNPSGASPF